MDPEDKRKLQRVLELAEENNSMLKKLVRAMRWAKILRVIYFLIIIGSAIGIFYILQPVFDQVADTYGSFRDSLNQINDLFR